MLPSSSQHTISLRKLSNFESLDGKGRIHISPHALIGLIRSQAQAPGRVAGGNGAALTQQRTESFHSDLIDLTDDVDASQDKRGSSSVIDSNNVPVVQHRFDIQCTTELDEESEEVRQFRRLGHLNLQDEEEELLSALRGTKEATEPRYMDFGDVDLILSGTRILVQKGNPFPRVLLRLPKFLDGLDSEAYGYKQSSEDMILCALSLRNHGKVTVSAKLSMTSLPPSAVNKEKYEIPLLIHVEVSVSLVIPALFQPGPSKAASDIGEFQRRFLSFLFTRAAFAPPPQYSGETDIPFFFSVIHPAPPLPTLMANDAAQPEKLMPTLLPFQRRTVGWLLRREGKMIDYAGRIIPIPQADSDLPLFWTAVQPSPGRVWYFNRLTGAVSPERPEPDAFLGAMLAEEPGLGKTLESIALLMLNPPPEERNPSRKRWDPATELDVKEIRTTLIVTPASLAPQWIDELAQHAPRLRVLVYDGWSKVPVPTTEEELEEINKQGIKRRRPTQHKATKRAKVAKTGSRKGKEKAADTDDTEPDDDEQEEEVIEEIDYNLDWCRYVNQFDVCVTTYNVLQQDLGVARAPVKRPRREIGNYSNLVRSRSPLVMCEWYRVIMDEVQMVGGGKTEEMVSLIPRHSSLAVSGTPARASGADLIHVVKFLRVEVVIESSRVWNRLLRPGYAKDFADLFSMIAVRTIKSAVKDELTIPQQTRYIVPITLGKVERHVYDQNLEEALQELGLDARGIAASDGWQVDLAVLRTWLRRLRGLCTHPQVGQLMRQGNNLMKPGGLKSIGEVLQQMVDINWRTLMDNCKSRILSLIRKARLMQHDQANMQRYRNALDVLLQVRNDMADIIKDIQAEIDENEVTGERLKAEQASAQSSNQDNSDKGKGREEGTPFSDDSSDDGLPVTFAAEQFRTKRLALQSRLREASVVMHQLHFLLGDVYHILGPSHSSSEDEAYASAEKVRKDLLKTTEEAANQSMTSLRFTAAKKLVTEELLHIHYCGKGGIRSDHLLREADDIIDVLNEQAELLWEWREKLYGLLTEKLTVGEGEEADGEEYARTLETQQEAESYLQAYSALLADRREVLVAERTALAAHDVRETKLRHTKAATRAAAALDDPDLLGQIDFLAPEQEVLKAELMARRRDILEKYQGRAIKSVMVDLNSIVNRAFKDDDPEKIIAKEWATTMRRLISSQGSLHDKLESDLAQFRRTFNDRIQYFRQLQELSDTVAEVQWEGTLRGAINETSNEIISLEAEVNKNRARHRYLTNLVKDQEGPKDEDDGICILCRCEFVRGFITQCAHVFCEGCLKAWIARREGKTCPVCRVLVSSDQVQRITMEDKNEQQQKPQLPVSNDSVPKSQRVITYNVAPPSLMEKVHAMEFHGSYGAKIETLVKHLLLLQDEDPGAKSIVFSAWSDSLHIIQHALTANGIPNLTIDQARGKQSAAKKFKEDPDLLVLLLHGERENAGLNVTCASRVFLVESVVQHAFEIQAIARIDRMGQTRPTEVYCYYAEDTVEKNILDLAARQGLSLYLKDHSSGTLSVTPLTMDPNNKAKAEGSPKRSKQKQKQKGDFILKSDDMLAILFPHMYEDLEYLVPEFGKDIEDDVDMSDILEHEQAFSVTPAPVFSSFEAQAGPSRPRRR